MRYDAIRRLNSDERDVQRGGNRERSSKGCARTMVVMMMTMMVSVMMFVTVM